MCRVSTVAKEELDMSQTADALQKFSELISLAFRLRLRLRLRLSPNLNLHLSLNFNAKNKLVENLRRVLKVAKTFRVEIKNMTDVCK